MRYDMKPLPVMISKQERVEMISRIRVFAIVALAWLIVQPSQALASDYEKATALSEMDQKFAKDLKQFFSPYEEASDKTLRLYFYKKNAFRLIDKEGVIFASGQIAGSGKNACLDRTLEIPLHSLNQMIVLHFEKCRLHVSKERYEKMILRPGLYSYRLGEKEREFEFKLIYGVVFQDGLVSFERYVLEGQIVLDLDFRRNGSGDLWVKAETHKDLFKITGWDETLDFNRDQIKDFFVKPYGPDAEPDPDGKDRKNKLSVAGRSIGGKIHRQYYPLSFLDSKYWNYGGDILRNEIQLTPVLDAALRYHLPFAGLRVHPKFSEKLNELGRKINHEGEKVRVQFKEKLKLKFLDITEDLKRRAKEINGIKEKLLTAESPSKRKELQKRLREKVRELQALTNGSIKKAEGLKDESESEFRDIFEELQEEMILKARNQDPGIEEFFATREDFRLRHSRLIEQSGLRVYKSLLEAMHQVKLKEQSSPLSDDGSF